MDQVKVTAFGPVVNLASRLEGLTKAFGLEVNMDDATAMGLVEHQDELEFRVRRLAKVRPSGIEFATADLRIGLQRCALECPHHFRAI